MYSVCVSVHRAPPPHPLAVMKGKLIPPSGHGLRNQFGTTELLLFWKSGKWDQPLQQERTCQGSVCSSFPGAPEPSARSVTDLARRRYLGGHKIPRVLGPRIFAKLNSKVQNWLWVVASNRSEINPRFHTESEDSGRHGRAARAGKSPSPSTSPGSFQERRIRGGRGAVLRLHSPVRLCSLGGSSSREVTIARSGDCGVSGSWAARAPLYSASGAHALRGRTFVLHGKAARERAWSAGLRTLLRDSENGVPTPC